MHVCLTSVELFGDKVYGGFGRACMKIGRELAARGVTVSIVVPRRSGERPDEYEVDGVRIVQFDARRPWRGVEAFRRCDADVYHSQDPSLGTSLALRARPKAAHVVTFRDPMDATDWEIETRYANGGRFGWRLYRAFVSGSPVRRAVERIDARFCAARFLQAKVRRIYGLDAEPGFLPTPVDVPASVAKAEVPTVCFVGRFEPRKRPELFFDLAEACPDVRFVAVGGAQDPHRERALRERYGSLPNLELTGFVDQFGSDRLWDVLSTSWILVNTSAREGLPTTFLEAAAYRCALLSHSDPDGFTSRFGLVADDDHPSLVSGLRGLLHESRWRALGERGHAEVSETFETGRAIDAHLAVYRDLT